MAGLLENVLDVGGVSAAVYDITRDAGDAAAAGGYSAWVRSVTGSTPQVRRNERGQAVVYMGAEQQAVMRSWLDKQITGAILPEKEPKDLRIEFAPVVTPLMLKYAVVIGGAFFLLGFFGRGMLR